MINREPLVILDLWIIVLDVWIWSLDVLFPAPDVAMEIECCYTFLSQSTILQLTAQYGTVNIVLFSASQMK